MAESIPISLIIAWIIFFGFLNTHQRHAKDFRGSSQNYLLTLNASVLLGRLVTIGLLVYYFMQVAWYWPIALFIFGSIAAGLLFSLLDVTIGQLVMSVLAFIGWPAAAVWAFFIISDIKGLSLAM